MRTPYNQDIFLVPKEVLIIGLHFTSPLLIVSSVSCTLTVVLPV